MNRRDFVRILALTIGSTSFYGGDSLVFASGKASSTQLKKKIPSTGELIPAVGMGTWITFNVGVSKELRDQRALILKEFFAGGGELIDSSPMYGSSEEVVGYALKKLGIPKSLFSATKIWTPSTEEGIKQFKTSKELWGVPSFALEQVHNLVNNKDHLKNLLQLKESGQVKYIGVTTSHGRRHDELEKIIKSYKLDFVQLTYNIQDRDADSKLLGVAEERGIAVIANRPYGGGELIDRIQKNPLPPWAHEVGCANWPEFLLKFIVSHPAITCAIPATTQLAHMRENMKASRGEFPDQKGRKRMVAHIESL